MSDAAYKGFRARFEFDAEDMVFTGRVLGINDVIGFHAESTGDLIAAFHEAVDDYMETCAKLGKEPEKPYSGKVMLRVDPALHANVAIAAELSGKSINQLGEEALRAAVFKVAPDLAEAVPA